MHENSPAAKAGLRSHSDYIIGAENAVLATENDFGRLMSDFEKRPLKLYVYNHEDDAAREVTVVPDASWGGGGRYTLRAQMEPSKQLLNRTRCSLGCSIGHGLIHRIPQR